MASDEHFRKLERMYLGAPTNEYFRLSIAIRKGEAEIRIPVRRDFFHAAGAVHGHVYFKALDDACFFAVNSFVEDVFVLTAVFETKLLQPIRSGTMTAIGKVMSSSRRLYTAEADLCDSDGQVIGKGSGKFVRSSIVLTPELGYR